MTYGQRVYGSKKVGTTDLAGVKKVRKEMELQRYA